MIGDALFIGLLYAFLAGGCINNLGMVQLRGMWLTVVALMIQYGGQWLFDHGVSGMATIGPGLYLMSIAVILLFVWWNRIHPGMKLAGVGILCNVAAISAYSGRMPVSLTAVEQAGLVNSQAPLLNGSVLTHTAMKPFGMANWLGDIIPLPAPYPRPKVVSIGDLILAAGVIYFVVATMRPWPWKRSHSKATAQL